MTINEFKEQVRITELALNRIESEEIIFALESMEDTVVAVENNRVFVMGSWAQLPVAYCYDSEEDSVTELSLSELLCSYPKVAIKLSRAFEKKALPKFGQLNLTI